MSHQRTKETCEICVTGQILQAMSSSVILAEPGQLSLYQGIYYTFQPIVQARYSYLVPVMHPSGLINQIILQSMGQIILLSRGFLTL